MARALTYLGIVSLGLAAAIAACSGNPTVDGGDGKDGDGDLGDDGLGGDDDGDGPSTNDRIVYRRPVEGFKNHDDGTGTPAYRSPSLSKEDAAILTAALANPPAEDEGLAIAYPFANTMVPGNLTFIEFQWKRADAQAAFLIRATSGDKAYHLYLDAECPANNYCLRTLPQNEWLSLGRDLAGKDVDFEIWGSDGSTVTRSPKRTIRFSPEPLVGALYYWASSNNAVKRASFGSEHAVDFIVPNSPTSDYECVGCHSVSRDGSTIAFAVSPPHGENISGIQTASTVDPTQKYINPTRGKTPFIDNANGATEGPVDNFGHNVALSPDGARMAVNATDPPSNWPSRLDIRNTKSSDSVIASYEFGHPIFGGEKIGIHPEFSPDGTKLAVMLAEKSSNDIGLSAWSAQKGGIAVLPIGGDGTLGNAQVIVTTPTDGNYHFYPTWSPDGRYLAFVTSKDPNGNSGSLGNGHGVLRMVEIAKAPVTCPGPNCIELTLGTGYTVANAEAKQGTTGSTWPKFAPFAQGADKSVYFITFTSRKRYGVRPISSTQLWMFGIDTKKAGDPSFSAFWLPYQEISDGSLSPYWTNTLPCNTEGDECNGCLEAEVCAINTDDNSCSCATMPRAR